MPDLQNLTNCTVSCRRWLCCKPRALCGYRSWVASTVNNHDPRMPSAAGSSDGILSMGCPGSVLSIGPAYGSLFVLFCQLAPRMATARNRFFDQPQPLEFASILQLASRMAAARVGSLIWFGSSCLFYFDCLRWTRFTSPSEMAKGKTICCSVNVIVDLSTSYADNSLVSPAPRGGSHTKPARM